MKRKMMIDIIVVGKWAWHMVMMMIKVMSGDE